MKFRVLRGKHHTGGGSRHTDPMVYAPGDIVESDVNLVDLFGKQKFEVAGDVAVEEAVDFRTLTLPKLRKFAADNEIDLDGATKKAAILAILEEEF